MKKQLLIFGTILSVFVTGAVQADANAFYAGAKLRKIEILYSNDDLDESASTLGILLGYKLVSSHWVSLNIEAEFARSAAEGEFDDPDVTPLKGEWDIDTQAIYGVFTFGTKVYGKVKIGSSRSMITKRYAGVSRKYDETGPAAGIGLGIRFNDHLRVEVEKTIDNAGNDFQGTSIGVNYRF